MFGLGQEGAWLAIHSIEYQTMYTYSKIARREWRSMVVKCKFVMHRSISQWRNADMFEKSNRKQKTCAFPQRCRRSVI